MTIPNERLRILVADDDMGDRRIVRRALKKTGVRGEVVEAQSADEAIRLLESEGADCAILDHHMPGTTGVDAIVEIRRRWPFLPVVMVTGCGDELVAAEAVKRGAADYLPKSGLTPDFLKASLDHAFEKERLREKVERQRQELESFARILAHDLMEPVRSTGLAAAKVKESIELNTLDRVPRYCDTLMRLSRTMRCLIEDLQTHTRIDEPSEPEAVDLNIALDDARQALDAKIEKAGAVLSSGRLPMVSGHQTQLTQLFLNLIGNSLKYCGEAQPSVQVDAVDQGDRWRISVADNGVGVPEEFRRGIFKQFARLHSGSRHEGSGLGLATCDKIVARHGGEIWCEGRDGPGAVFAFTLAKPAAG